MSHKRVVLARILEAEIDELERYAKITIHPKPSKKMIDNLRLLYRVAWETAKADDELDAVKKSMI